jgi:hypothetical protein
MGNHIVHLYNESLKNNLEFGYYYPEGYIGLKTDLHECQKYCKSSLTSIIFMLYWAAAGQHYPLAYNDYILYRTIFLFDKI